MNYKSLLRFCLVGVANTVIDFLLFTVFVYIGGMNYLVAQMISYSAGVVNSFVMNKFWAFANTEPSVAASRQFIRFVIANLLCVGISVIGLKGLRYLGLNVYTAKVLLTGVLW